MLQPDDPNQLPTQAMAEDLWRARHTRSTSHEGEASTSRLVDSVAGMGEAADDWEVAVHPPEVFLEPWTLRRPRRLAWGLDDLSPLLVVASPNRRAGDSR